MMLKVRTIAKTKFVFSLVYAVGLIATNLVPTSQAQIPQTPGKTVISQAVDEDYNLKFESGGCKRTGTTKVICNVIVTNTSDTRQEVYFTGNVNLKSYLTDAIDASGTVYSTKLAQSGAHESDTAGAFFFNINLAMNVPIKVAFTFDIPREVTQLSALDVGYRIDKKEKRIALSNIGTIATSAPQKNRRR